MWHNTMWHYTMWHNTMWHYTMWHNTMWHYTMRHKMMWHYTMQHYTMWQGEVGHGGCNGVCCVTRQCTMWHGVVQRCVTQYDVTRCDLVLCGTLRCDAVLCDTVRWRITQIPIPTTHPTPTATFSGSCKTKFTVFGRAFKMGSVSRCGQPGEGHTVSPTDQNCPRGFKILYTERIWKGELVWWGVR